MSVHPSRHSNISLFSLPAAVFGLVALLVPASADDEDLIGPPNSSLRTPVGDFYSSFEDGETPQAMENRVEKDKQNNPFQKNVTGMARNALMEKIAQITASAENAPNESAACAADGAPDTKWLAFQSSGWLQYNLAQAGTAVSYSIASANDHPERDPKDWKVSGSDDGRQWTTLDTQTNQAWGPRDRLVTKSYTLKSAKAYSFYRLEITAESFQNPPSLSSHHT